MGQGRLFDLGAGRGAYGHPLAPRDPHVTAEPERRRLSGQNAAILARLREGPATNAELAEISLKYTGRLSDLRAAGYVVNSRRAGGGTWLYTLVAAS